MPEKKVGSEPLKGWQQIAEFLGQPVSVAHRWAKSGMPVSHEGRRVRASGDDLNRWLERQSAEPVQIATNTNDLGPELKRGLSYIRKQGTVAKPRATKVEDHR
jgi:hypothetical protein